MIRVYTLLLYLALPLAFLRLWWRGFRLPGYRRYWRERLGVVNGFDDTSPAIWLHAVSVGEVRAAAPLVNALLQRYPQSPLLLTTTTPTGRDTAMQLFGQRVRYAYLPWDLPFAVKRFLSSVRPGKAIVMETELWPNLFHQLKQGGIPLYLVNARLSDASLQGYRRIRPLTRSTLACVTGIAAQSDAAMKRFIMLGAAPDVVHHAGNLKYEAGLPEDFERYVGSLQRSFGQREAMWVAGSTHPGEEPVVLAVHQHLLRENPDCLLWLVPRHPERAAELVLLSERAGMRVVLYSEFLREGEGLVTCPNPGRLQVIVVDVLGVLVYLYGLAPVAFLGGSLVSHGGHNPLEALQAGCAVVSGAHVDNFAEVYQQLDSAGAATHVTDEASLTKAITCLLGDGALRQQQLAAGEQVLKRNRGALARVLAMLAPSVIARRGAPWQSPSG